MKRALYLTLALFVLTLGLIFFEVNFLVIFFFIAVTLVMGSKLLGNATEEIANYYSPTAGGLLNATMGNLAELIIAIFALRAGLVDVVKASITGSIIGNVLLVFGAAVFVGGFKFKESKLNKREAQVSSTMLLITSLLLLLPSILGFFHEELYTPQISYAVAASLFILYICSMIFSFVTHKHYFTVGEKEKPKMKKLHAFLLLIFSVVILVILSELFASRLEEFAHSVGWGELFIGAILVGIVGNAAEHLSALQFAMKGKTSLVLNVTIGSSLQIGMFVAPLLVFISWFMGAPMTLAFIPIEIIAIILSVFLINEIASDGEVNWLEGLQLLFLYVVLAILFYFYH